MPKAGVVIHIHRAHETPEHLVCRLLLEKKKLKPEAKREVKKKTTDTVEDLKEFSERTMHSDYDHVIDAAEEINNEYELIVSFEI
ncbi:hypothetical protein EHSB41UT_04822 [Parendozoicomonas haliclonae]|uniref:Uncharacterized protein n=1 Tax=Parendozoicomonas haliclonae TaxID=1960125 RepID=A0A1X7ARR2_9GAMM|nr:hypothetical protein EHSB41UT_04822 [Parendozoicomonas haliclonae]